MDFRDKILVLHVNGLGLSPSSDTHLLCDCKHLTSLRK